jgi:hypothetical protein
LAATPNNKTKGKLVVTITSLALAVVLATALTWIASALIWTVLPWHKRDFRAFPDEEAARRVLRAQHLAPGQYHVPHASSMAEMKQPEMQRKLDEGPVGFMTVMPNGMMSMAKAMILSGVFYLLVSIVVAYVATRSLAPGAQTETVFRIVTTTTWLAYGAALVPEGIWFGRPWSGVLKGLGDALIYAVLTGAVFAWLWP